MTSVTGVLRAIAFQPNRMLLEKWNWKSALFSSAIRALIFLFSNLAAGWRAASGAMLAEFLYRAVTAGFYGALTQAFRECEPPWTANIAVMLLLPLASHSIEFGVHVLRGTPKIITSMIASIIFTMISTLFNLYAMRRGALVVGEGCGSMASDMKRMPELIGGFLFEPVRFLLSLRGGGKQAEPAR